MEKILFIFKDKPWYLQHIKVKFKNNYNCKFFFLDQSLQHTRNTIIEKINIYIQKKKISKIFFDIDYNSFIDKNFISKIKVEQKILFSFDSEENLKKIDRNLQVCSHFLVGEPKISRHFDKINYLFFPLETNSKFFYKKKIKKKYDVFFFGETKLDRLKYLNILNKFKIKKKILLNTRNAISINKINTLINESKIVLNFSLGYNRYNKKKFNQFKGRVLMSGLAGTFCLSQDYDSKDLIFTQQFPTFSNEKEMIKNINLLLQNKNKLKKITDNFCLLCKKYSDQTYIKKIVDFLKIKKTFKKTDLDIYEIINILKISSKKNNIYIYRQNVLNVFKDYVKKFNLFKIFFLPYLFVMTLICLIILLKKNAKSTT
jgi:hypothetical protein